MPNKTIVFVVVTFVAGGFCILAYRLWTPTDRNPPFLGAETRWNHPLTPDSTDNKVGRQGLTVSELKQIPKAFLGEVLKKCFPRQRNRLFAELGKTDFMLALELANYAPFPVVSKSYALFGYAQISPIEALAWARVNAGLGAGPGKDQFVKNEFIRDWSAGSYARDPKGFMDLLKTHSYPEEMSDISKGVIHYAEITGEYEKLFSNEAATAFVLQYNSESLLQGMATNWARKSPSDAIMFLSTLSSENKYHMPLMKAAASEYAAVDPHAAIEWAVGEDEKYGYDMTSIAIYGYVQQSKDPTVVLEWIVARLGTEPAHVDAALLHVARAVNKTDFEKGLQLATRINDPVMRRRALDSIKLNWSENLKFKTYIATQVDPAVAQELFGKR